MFGGINPGQMKAMMKQMGIKQEEIDAERVVIECKDKKIIIEPASVQKITMQGQGSWQITGNVREESNEVEFSDEDIQLVMEQTGKSEKEIKASLSKTRDLAQSIEELSE